MDVTSNELRIGFRNEQRVKEPDKHVHHNNFDKFTKSLKNTHLWSGENFSSNSTIFRKVFEINPIQHYNFCPKKVQTIHHWYPLGKYFQFVAWYSLRLCLA